MNELAVIINSFDGFSDCWPGVLHGLTKYWPDCPYPIHLITNFKRIDHPHVSVLQTGNDISWSDQLLAATAHIHSRYILLFLEDYWLTTPVDTQRVKDFASLMQTEDLNYIRLLAVPPPDLDFPADPRLGVIAVGASYRTATQIALWRSEVLQNLLISGESAWQFELAGTVRSRRYGDTFLSVKANGNDPYFWGMRYLCTAVNRGRWARAAKRYAEAEGVAIDFSRRPSETWWDDFKRSGRVGSAMAVGEHRLRLLQRDPPEALRTAVRRRAARRKAS
jgi:hypothetical protein